MIATDEVLNDIAAEQKAKTIKKQAAQSIRDLWNKRREKMLELSDAGWTYHEIGIAMGVTAQTVGTHVRRARHRKVK